MRGIVVVAGVAALALGACAGPQESFVGPSGETVHEVKCSGGKGECFETAAATCGAEGYRALDSHSRSGGLLADALPGPVTWYYLTYACGAPDGVMPGFAREGHDAPLILPNPAPAYSAPRVTHCTPMGLGVSCTSS